MRINAAWAPSHWAARFAGGVQFSSDAELAITYAQPYRALDLGLASAGLVRFFISGGMAPAEEGNRNANSGSESVIV